MPHNLLKLTTTQLRKTKTALMVADYLICKLDHITNQNWLSDVTEEPTDYQYSVSDLIQFLKQINN